MRDLSVCQYYIREEVRYYNLRYIRFLVHLIKYIHTHTNTKTNCFAPNVHACTWYYICIYIRNKQRQTLSIPVMQSHSENEVLIKYITM